MKLSNFKDLGFELEWGANMKLAPRRKERFVVALDDKTRLRDGLKSSSWLGRRVYWATCEQF